jgi:hypothetical protein
VNDSRDLTAVLFLEHNAPLSDHMLSRMCLAVSVVDFSPVYFLGHFS